MNLLADLLACPICHADLSIEGETCNCLGCGLVYRKDNAIHSFIHPQMYKSQEDYSNAMKVIDFWGKGWEKRLAEEEHAFLFDFGREGLLRHMGEDVDDQCRRRFLFGKEVDLDTLSGKTALNIGCGAGTESLILAGHGAACIAMDITVPAVSAAVRLMDTLENPGLGIQGDARFLPLKDNSIDLVYSSGVLHHSPDIEKSISEIFRVLRPSGHACIMLYAKWSVLFMQERLKGFLKGHMSGKSQQQYITEAGEGAWRTEGRRNPHTELFTSRQCRQLFDRFGSVKVRKGGFSLSQIAWLHKVIPTSKLDNFSLANLTFLDRYLGPCIFINVWKS